MSEKVTVPKEVAEAIEQLRNLGTNNATIVSFMLDKEWVLRPIDACAVKKIQDWFSPDYDDLLNALVNGYEVEERPEDKIKRHYDDLKRKKRNIDSISFKKFASGEITGIIVTLNLLNIKIPGVNVDK